VAQSPDRSTADADEIARRRQQAAVEVVVGYFAACLAAVTVYFAGLWIVGTGEIPLGELAALMLYSLLFLSFVALPGFVLFRIAIAYVARRAGRAGWLTFVVAGALNAGVTIGLIDLYDRLVRGLETQGPGFSGMILAGLLFAGGFGGLASWAAERAVARLFDAPDVKEGGA
jgi:ABC-type multidrug transport system fused ATPase/permease subunit